MMLSSVHCINAVNHALPLLLQIHVLYLLNMPLNNIALLLSGKNLLFLIHKQGMYAVCIAKIKLITLMLHHNPWVMGEVMHACCLLVQSYEPMASALPPMSSFRGPGASSTTGGSSVATSSPLYTHSPVPNHTQATATANTGDTLGKALSSVSTGHGGCCCWGVLYT